MADFSLIKWLVTDREADYFRGRIVGCHYDYTSNQFQLTLESSFFPLSADNQLLFVKNVGWTRLLFYDLVRKVIASDSETSKELTYFHGLTIINDPLRPGVPLLRLKER